MSCVKIMICMLNCESNYTLWKTAMWVKHSTMCNTVLTLHNILHSKLLHDQRLWWLWQIWGVRGTYYVVIRTYLILKKVPIWNTLVYTIHKCSRSSTSSKHWVAKETVEDTSNIWEGGPRQNHTDCCHPSALARSERKSSTSRQSLFASWKQPASEVEIA